MENLDLAMKCTEASIMIMGMSFILGSLTTIFILVVLDLYRCRNANDKSKDEN